MKRVELVSLDTLRERALYFSKKKYNFGKYKISKDSNESLIN